MRAAPSVSAKKSKIHRRVQVRAMQTVRASSQKCARSTRKIYLLGNGGQESRESPLSETDGREAQAASPCTAPQEVYCLLVTLLLQTTAAAHDVLPSRPHHRPCRRDGRGYSGLNREDVTDSARRSGRKLWLVPARFSRPSTPPTPSLPAPDRPSSGSPSSCAPQGEASGRS